MRKLIIIFIIMVVAQQLYKYHIGNTNGNGIFDAEGNPLTIVFTCNECGKLCDDVLALLDRRDIEYEEVNISDGEEQMQRFKAYGKSRPIWGVGKLFRKYEIPLPLLVVGNHHIAGYHRSTIASILAQAYGMEALRWDEKRAMENHFDADGNPRVIMYGVDWCGYCKRTREYFASKGIDYEELDVEKSIVAREYFDTLEGGGFPLIYIGFHRIRGFNTQALDKALAQFL